MSLQRVVGLITVRHHAETVCHPETDKVLSTVSSLPCSHSPEVVVVLELHVVNHPGEALSIAIIPCAETSSLFRPEIDHLSGVVGWVRDEAGDCKGRSHEDGLADLVADVVVYPEQEELVLQENVEVHICCPEQELVHSQRESSLEQVSWALLNWDPH